VRVLSAGAEIESSKQGGTRVACYCRIAHLNPEKALAGRIQREHHPSLINFCIGQPAGGESLEGAGQ
jgi:hypothetical protein